MLKEKDYYIDTLILEIDVDHGVVGEYQRTLYEASIMGIKHVLFAPLFSNDETGEKSRGEDMSLKIMNTCEVLEIQPLPIQISYEGSIYDGPMVGQVNDHGTIKSIMPYDLQSFEEYKKGQPNLIKNRDSVGKVLSKYMVEWYK